MYLRASSYARVKGRLAVYSMQKIIASKLMLAKSHGSLKFLFVSHFRLSLDAAVIDFLETRQLPRIDMLSKNVAFETS